MSESESCRTIFAGGAIRAQCGAPASGRIQHLDSTPGGTGMLSGALVGDFRFALRMIRRSPMFAATVVLTVTIAIAANATIFTVVNAVMIRSLPYPQPERIMQLAEKNEKLDLPTFAVSALNFLSWREQTHTFEHLSAMGF